MDIQHHPDISAIRQLARSLYGQGTANGAAALVGAGMSRSARTLQNMPAPPLWNDLREQMIIELYGRQKVSSDTTSATQLAEEFRSTLGDAAMVDFLKRNITDDAWEPNQIHTDLLKLPWSDVMTTNYDTLLERAARDSERRYVPVLNEGDLAHACSPRIIKLHGTAQNMHDVIFSEEDYRTYPDKHPAFLNTARQVFIENELCLIGFSGEDPNFLSWAGWVRDILKSGARRIFLVGVLNLNHSKRKLFERQNIIPIDLGCLFEVEENQNHQQAYEVFFQYLRSLERQAPDEWLLTSLHETWPRVHGETTKLLNDGELAKPVLLKTIDKWKKDRKRFPGWLVTPEDKRLELDRNTEILSFTEETLSALSKAERKSFLSELAWRQHKIMTPLSDFVLRQIIELADCPEGFATFSQELREDIFQVVVQSLYEIKGREKLTEFIETFYERETDPDLRAFIHYYQCIDAFRMLDFDYVAEHAENIVTQNADPIWLTRKAGLLFGIGNFKQAQRSLRDAISELKTLRRNDPDSMWVQSRLSWTMWVGNDPRWENSEFVDQENLLRKMSHFHGCDPQLYLETFRREFKDALTEQANKKKIVPRFDTGTFKDSSQTITIGGPSWRRGYYRFFLTLALTGVPFKTDHIDYVATTARQAYELNREENLGWYLSLLSTHPRYDSDLINRNLSRVAVARLGAELVDEIVPHVKNGVEFWRKKIRGDDGHYNIFAVERLRTLIEVLSRFSIRMDSGKAIQYFKFGCCLAHDTSLRHFWLFGPLANLLKNTHSAVESNQREELAKLLLDFPFAADISGPMEREWPDIASIGYGDFEYSGKKTICAKRFQIFLKSSQATTGYVRNLLYASLTCLKQNC